MKHKKYKIMFIIIILLLLVAVTIALTLKFNKNITSAEMQKLRKVEASLIPTNSIVRNEFDDGCKRVSAISGPSDGVSCKQHIRNVYTGVEMHKSLEETLINNGWIASDSNIGVDLHYRNTVDNLDVCIDLDQANVDFESENVNTIITIATMMDEYCWSWFSKEPRGLN